MITTDELQRAEAGGFQRYGQGENRSTVHISLQIRSKDAARLEATAGAMGISRSEAVRRGVLAWMANQEARSLREPR
jgi:hypothetical protein